MKAGNPRRPKWIRRVQRAAEEMLKIQRSKEEASGKTTQWTWKESANAKGNPRKMKTDAAAAVMKDAGEDDGAKSADLEAAVLEAAESVSPFQPGPGLLAWGQESAHA